MHHRPGRHQQPGAVGRLACGVPGAGPDAITASSTPRARSGCSGVELEGDVILVDDDSGAVHLLNPTAQLVWSCFDGSATIAEIARDLDTVFAADPATIADAVTDLARQLARSGLLEGVGATEAPAEAHARFSDRPPST